MGTLSAPLDDDPQADAKAPWQRTALVLIAVWLAASTLLAVVLSAQEGLDFRYSFTSSAVDQALLGVLLAGVWLVLKRTQHRSLAFKVALHLGLAAVVIPTWEYLKRLSLARLASPEVVEIYVEEAGYWVWLQSLTIYSVAVAALLVVLTFRRLREEERRASRLQILMRDAELRALRAQLRPHFLFNTLNSIYSLIHSRPDEAAEMVALLSDLLRETLEHRDQSTVPLASELQLVERYLSIESVRMGDRLQIEIEVPENTLRAEVPPFLLQPLVENAIRHGAAPSVDLVTVRVEATRVYDRIVLRVIDDGCGLVADNPEEEKEAPTEPAAEASTLGSAKPRAARSSRPGHGLRITRSRLEVHHGSNFEFSLRANIPRGCVAQVEMPYLSNQSQAETHPR